MKKKGRGRDHTQDGYDIGYRKPPAHSRFKPGKSGNPTGRPKGSRNLPSIFRKVLNEKITLHEGDRVWLATKFEAMIRRLSQNALKGDVKSITTILTETKEIGQFDEPHQQKLVVRFVHAENGKPT